MSCNCQPFCITNIVFSSKSEMLKTLSSLDSGNVALIMSYSAAVRFGMTSFIDNWRERLQKHGSQLVWLNSVPAHPTPKDILAALDQIADQTLDVIVAIGGGSAIDLAKAVSALKEKNRSYTLDEIIDSIASKKYHESGFVDIIAIPTTAGTGSELTQWATIWDMENTHKFSIDSPKLKPRMAIIVPELTLSVPPLLTLSTGLDAMCQAIEAYWSKRTSPIVQEIAYRAVELVIDNLGNAVKKPFDLQAREMLCRASVLAGLAFSQTRTTACHSISYPLTMLYGMPHGLASAVTLEPVGRLNQGHFPNDQRLFSLFDNYGGIMKWIDSISEDVVCIRLSTFGVADRDIPIIVDRAFTAGRMDNNPVELSEEDVTRILLSVL